MLRLFVGFKVPENVSEQLENLKGGIPRARWIPKENYHLTLSFIGEVDEVTAEEADNALRGISFPSFDLSLCQIGYFTKNKDEVRTLWTGVDNYHVLDRLHEKIDVALQNRRIDISKTRFHAHCTLAKMQGTSIDEAQKYVAMHNLFRSKPFYVDKFYLFESIRGSSGSHYKILAEYELYQKIEQL
ncbi:MAG: RNA 2',3'-cyclic phosphodiesterase [Alphaproteobacteria bacterium]